MELEYQLLLVVMVFPVVHLDIMLEAVQVVQVVVLLDQEQVEKVVGEMVDFQDLTQLLELQIVVAEVELEVNLVLVLLVVQELLLLDTNFKINMYLLVFKINI
jgi:hypothetical protein